MTGDLVTGDLGLLLPEIVLAAGVLAVLVADLLAPARRGGGVVWVGVLACAAAAVLALAGEARGSFAQMLAVDWITGLARPVIVIATALVLVAGRAENADEDAGAWTGMVTGLGLGALVVAASSNLLTLWLGLELVSLSSYVLAAWRSRDRLAAEAGMKFVLFGGAASALMLYGISHVYGLTGHLDFAGIGEALAGDMPIATVAALCLASSGLAYKLSLVPFHFYAPDVYQGAPAHSVALVSVVPKIAACACGVRLLASVPGSLAPPASVGWGLTAAAAASLLVASFTALAQRDGKRIIAFSSIGHAGAVVLALACLPSSYAVAAAAFYLVAYAAANLGALVCLALIERERGSSALGALHGLIRTRPWLTAALCLFLASLAGIPPLAGFLAKWGVLRETLAVGLDDASRQYLAWAALALVVSTVISAWSYLLIVRAAVLAPAPEPVVPSTARVDLGSLVVLVACAAVTVGAGLWLDGFAAIARAAS